MCYTLFMWYFVLYIILIMHFVYYILIDFKMYGLKIFPHISV